MSEPKIPTETIFEDENYRLEHYGSAYQLFAKSHEQPVSAWPDYAVRWAAIHIEYRQKCAAERVVNSLEKGYRVAQTGQKGGTSP